MSWQSFRGNAPANMTIYSASFPDISDQWPMKDDVTREINALNQAMKTHPQLLPPLLEAGENGLPRLIPQHLHSDQAYRNRPAMAAWRARLVPSALALFVVQNPLEERLPEGTRMDSESRQWFIHANDAIGVRSRAQVLGALDVSFYRDDFSQNGLHPQVRPSELPFEIDGQHLVLIDDVLMSGRTIRDRKSVV